MPNYKLIDEDWIDKSIKEAEEAKRETIDMIHSAVIQGQINALKWAKEKLVPVVSNGSASANTKMNS